MLAFHILMAIFTLINIAFWCCLVVAKRADEHMERYMEEREKNND